MAQRSDEIEALARQLRETVGCDDTQRWDHARDIWAREPLRSMVPKTIQAPEQYDGAEGAGIACTQTALPARQQRLLVERWCSFLPTLPKLKWLWFHSKVPQELFEAACQVRQLQGLYVKWSGIEDLRPLHQCAHLRCLKLGSSASVKSLAPVSGLTRLEWLQLDNIKATTQIEPLTSLKKLEGLGFTGADLKRYTIDSFAPLAQLPQLRWLHLGGVHTKDLSLESFAALKQLEFLGLGNFFPMEEFARLSLHVSPEVCDWLAPYVRSHSSVFPCKKCNKNWLVMTSGQGGRLLCPSCDARSLARHVIEFEDAKKGLPRAAVSSPKLPPHSGESVA